MTGVKEEIEGSSHRGEGERRCSRNWPTSSSLAAVVDKLTLHRCALDVVKHLNYHHDDTMTPGSPRSVRTSNG